VSTAGSRPTRSVSARPRWPCSARLSRSSREWPTRCSRSGSSACRGAAARAASSVVRGFLVTGMFSTFLLGVLYLQHVHGYGALLTGLAFLPLTLVLRVLYPGVT